MNRGQFKEHVSHMCLAGAMIASWSLMQEMTGSNPFTVMTNIQTKFGVRSCFHRCLSVHREAGGGGWLPSMHHRSHDQGGLPPGGSVSGESLYRGGGVQLNWNQAGSTLNDSQLENKCKTLNANNYVPTSTQLTRFLAN